MKGGTRNLNDKIKDSQGSISFEKVLQASNSPLFGRRAYLTVPAWFMKEHGDKILKSVVLRSATTKEKWTVQLGIHYPRGIPQVKFHHGWREFASFNDLAEGDLLVFCLRAISEFDVYIYRKAGNPISAPSFKSPRKCLEEHESPRKRTKSIVQSEDKHSDAGAGKSSFTEVLSKERTVNEEVVDCVSNSTSLDSSSDVEMDFPVTISRNTSRVEKASSRKKQVDKCKDSVLQRRQKALPCFFKRIRISNLRDAKGYASGACLEIPRSFATMHSDLFRQQTVRLQGIRDESPVRRVARHSSEQGRQTRLFFRTGWSTFAAENNLRIGQWLVFTHTGNSFFVVKEAPAS